MSAAVLEKPEDYQIDKVDTHTPPEGSDAGYLESGSDINEKKLIRKVDWHIVPWLSLLYLLSFLDRSNIGNANLFGLSVNLKLSSTQYSACLAVFFAFYVLFEVPSNMVMKAWRPSMWLPIIMLGWGVVMIGMGFVKNFQHLLVARIFLGITEAGLFPGVSYYLTLWYKRYEINFRIAMFFSAATAAGAFGGLLARLINEMDGVSGYEGWRWIFILEGIATVVVAAGSFWMLHDYPQTSKFMTPQEQKFMVDRLHSDGDGLSSEFNYRFVWDAFLSWKVWVFAIMFQAALMPLYTFSIFSPTLVANLGYAAARAQLMSVPPYVVAAFTTVTVGYFSDRLKNRGLFTAAFSAMACLGYILLLSVHNKTGVAYFALFLASAGVYPLIPLVVSWGANNTGGSLKRGVATAIIVSLGNAGGVISSFIYPKEDRPRYIKGHAICAAYCGTCCILAIFMTWYLKRENVRRDAAIAARGKPYSAEEKKEYENEGDSAPFFRYVL